MTNLKEIELPDDSRTEPLTETEMRAALRAIHRILENARTAAMQRAGNDKLVEIMDWAEFLPEMLLKPGQFQAMFRLALVHLASRFYEFSGILTEFDDSLAGAGSR